MVQVFIHNAKTNIQLCKHKNTHTRITVYDILKLLRTYQQMPKTRHTYIKYVVNGWGLTYIIPQDYRHNVVCIRTYSLFTSSPKRRARKRTYTCTKQNAPIAQNITLLYKNNFIYDCLHELEKNDTNTRVSNHTTYYRLANHGILSNTSL